MNQKREMWVDAVRGFAIYLVVLGHCIQYATPIDYNFKNNIVFQLIYGFHMPLFMTISGYLFWYSLEKYNLLEGVWAKVKGIMIPCVVWGLVTYICDILLFDYKDVSFGGYIYYTVYSNWFLWAVFYCSLYGLITKHLFKNCIWGYLVVLACNFVIPEIGNYAGTKRMLPFFVLGIVLNRYRVTEKLKGKEIPVFIAFGIVYCITVKWQMVELITGLFGSLCIIIFFHKICEKYRIQILCKLGQASIVIYLFTGIVFYFVIKESFRIPESYRYLIKSVYVVGLSMILTLLAYGVSILLRKSRITNILFLGRDKS